jgi:hypothetical protein
LAFDGEVEDYRVNLVSAMPWTNGDTPLDVNADGTVAPLDALLVINELNNHEFSSADTGLLPNPPDPTHPPQTEGYVDVDGDGYVSPRDALLVINQLNMPVGAAGAKPEARAATAATTASDATSLMAAALLPTHDVRRMDAAVVDRLVEAADERKEARWFAPHDNTESLFADPRLDVADLELTMDQLASELGDHLSVDDRWMV